MRENPGLSVAALPNAANASRSSTGERLRLASEAGVVEKDNAGRWRLQGGGGGRTAPYDGASVEPTAATEAHHIDDGPAPAHQPWIRKLAAYDRRETRKCTGRVRLTPSCEGRLCALASGMTAFEFCSTPS